jgi:transcriptional regulator with XRE-family HTH domain
MNKSKTTCNMIGPYLLTIAKQLGQTPASVARTIGYNEPTVRQWLTGRRPLTIDNAFLIANAIGADFSIVIKAFSIGYTHHDATLLRSEFFSEWINSVFVIHQELGADTDELRASHAQTMRQKLLEASRSMISRKAMASLAF